MEIPVKTKIGRLPMKENSSGQNTDQNSKTPQLSLARRTFIKGIAALGAGVAAAPLLSEAAQAQVQAVPAYPTESGNNARHKLVGTLYSVQSAGTIF
jgi:hypothetical protein